MAEDRVSLPIDFGDGPRAAAELRERLEGAREAAAALGVVSVSTGDLLADAMDDATRAAVRTQQATASMTSSLATGATATAAAAAKAGEAVESVGRKATRSAENIRMGFGSFGLEFSRFAQDAAVGWEMGGLTGAVRATSNNVEFLIRSLGIGGGLVSALALVAGVAPLVMNALKGAFSEDIPEAFAERIAELEARLKELEESPLKLAADYTEIEAARAEVEKLRAAKDALDKVLGKQSEDERASGRAVGEVLAAPESRAVLADIKDQVPAAAAAADAALSGLNAAALAAKNEADRLEALAAATAGQAAGEGLARQAEAARAEATEAEAARVARERLVRDTALGEVNKAIEAATGGVGEAQRAAQARLRELLAGRGPGGQAAARGLDAASPDVMRDFRELREVGEQSEPAARMELARAERERAQSLRAEQEAAQIAQEADQRRDEEAEAARRRERERAQEAKRLATAYADAFATPVRDAGNAPDGKIAAMVAQGLRGRRGITDENAPEVARAIVERLRLEFDAKGAGQAARVLGDAIGPGVRQAIAGNEAAQLMGGGVPDATLEARLRAVAAQQAAALPGVGRDDAFEAAAQVIREMAEQHQQAVMALMAQGMNQAQAIRMIWAQAQQQNARAWGMNRFRPMAPSNLTMRPF